MVKGMLFDKDGTLIDFFALWLKAALEVVPGFLKENNLDRQEGMAEYILDSIGVSQGKIDPKGALAYKSYADIAADIAEALQKKGICMSVEHIQRQIESLFHKSVTGKSSVIREFTDVKQLVKTLKAKNIHVGLATADTEVSAKSCLRTLGVFEMFDYIGADNGVRNPKPEPDMFREFQKCFDLKPEEIVVVGDTYNDILFAKQNGGIAVGVLSGVSEESDFHGEADYIIESVDMLPEIIEMM